MIYWTIVVLSTLFSMKYLLICIYDIDNTLLFNKDNLIKIVFSPLLIQFS